MALSDLSSLVLPPPFEESSYESYKKELEIWKLMKACIPRELGPVVFRTLTGRAKSAALELTVQQIGSDEGLDLILKKLDKLFLPEKNQRICTTLEKFETFRRAPHQSMSDFILDFEKLHNRVKDFGCTYPDGVLAYRVMKAGNISKEHEKLLKATVPTGEWSYESVLTQLRKIFNDYNLNSTPCDDKPIKIEETFYGENCYPQEHYQYPQYESVDTIKYHDFNDHCENEPYSSELRGESPPADIYYGHSRSYQPQPSDIYYGSSRGNPSRFNSGRNFYSRNRPAYNQSNNFNQSNNINQRPNNNYSPNQNAFKRNLYTINPKDSRGNPTVCRKCRSIYHWWENCPHVSPQEKNNAKKVFYNQSDQGDFQDDVYVALFQKMSPTTPEEIICLLSETMNKAVIDSGCTKTCCGKEWYEAYLESLNANEREQIRSEESQSVFRFGDSEPVTSMKKVYLPIKIKNVDLILETEVVPSNIPLLLSKNTLKKAKAKQFYEDDKIELFGEEQPMQCTTSGHYAIPIVSSTPNVESNVVLLAHSDEKEKKITAKKLHVQFGHPMPNKLIKLIETSGMNDTELNSAIEEISANCDTCKRWKKAKPKPAVTFPLASQFNETVAMDLSFQKQQCLHASCD